MDAGIYKYIEKYSKSDGGFCDGVYYYNYCLETAPNLIQPSGAVNFSNIENASLQIHRANGLCAAAIRIYAININILHVNKGVCSLLYHN